jgi:hypothetical protein
MRSPRQVILFSGHMVDAPGRKVPRFPPEKAPIAAHAISATLDKLGAGPADLGLCGGASGGDLLFAEACLARGMRLELHIPLPEPDFLRTSVSFAEDSWLERYHRVKSNPQTAFHAAPDELGPLPAGADPFSRNNLWLMDTALAFGREKARFICLWNRQSGDGPGGTDHMYDVMRERCGEVYVLDTNQLWSQAAGAEPER